MAREWQPVASVDLIGQDDVASGDDRSVAADGRPRLERTWSSDRGSVLWEGTADLRGSFPGFAHWGSRAQSVQLTLTDRFLLVDEPSDHGFGLPIGWLSAAQALTGVEPIALESGDHLRICYVDGNRVRGFIVRIRGGRFGRSAGRRANLLRSAAITLGLASTTPSTDLLLPPEHDLALDWDDFASYESEPVIWTGRATMPVASGLEPASCDVWLTDASLIWGASSRAGIFRLATASLTGVTVAATPGRDPVIYWSLGGTHQTQVDLPMVFSRQDRAGYGTSPERSLLTVLGEHHYHVGQPATPPQPWRAGPHLLRPVPDVERFPSATNQSLALSATGHASQPASATSARSETAPAHGPVEGSRRRLLDDGLFPERTVPAMPRSEPLPWGDRVERIDEERQPTPEPDGGSGEDGGASQGNPPATQLANGAGRLRIWPAAAPKRETSSGTDAAAMLVRRPPVRATTTEEFLAAERTARLASALAPAIHDDALRQSTVIVPAESASRGVIVRFRPAEAPPTDPRVADCHLTGPTIAAPPAPTVGGGDRPSTGVRGADIAPGGLIVTAAAVQPAGGHSTATSVDGPDAPAEPQSHGSFETHVTLPVPSSSADDVADPIDSTFPGPTSPDSPAAIVAPRNEDEHRDVSGISGSTPLDQMRSILSRLDEHLALAIAGINEPAGEHVWPDSPSTGALVGAALRQLDRAVRDGQISPQGAQTHRQAITRTADTTERLRSLLDLHARKYLTTAQLTERRESLLGRTRPAGRAG